MGVLKSSWPWGWTSCTGKVVALLTLLPSVISGHKQGSPSAPNPWGRWGDRAFPCAAAATEAHPRPLQGREVRACCCEQPGTGHLSRNKEAAAPQPGLPAAAAPGDTVPKGSPPQALSLGQAQGGTHLYPPSFCAWGSALALLACGHMSFETISALSLGPVSPGPPQLTPTHKTPSRQPGFCLNELLSVFPWLCLEPSVEAHVPLCRPCSARGRPAFLDLWHHNKGPWHEQKSQRTCTKAL